MRLVVCSGAECGCVLALRAVGYMVWGLYVRQNKARSGGMCDVCVFDVVFRGCVFVYMALRDCDSVVV